MGIPGKPRVMVWEWEYRGFEGVTGVGVGYPLACKIKGILFACRCAEAARHICFHSSCTSLEGYTIAMMGKLTYCLCRM